MVNVSINVAKTVLYCGVAFALVILAKKVNPEGARYVLAKAAGATDLEQIIDQEPVIQL